MLSAALRSSARGDWETPPEVFDALDREFHFDLDVAAAPMNARCPRYLTAANDALDRATRWAAAAVWCNPPYGRGVARWLARAVEEVHDTRVAGVVVVLLPARTDTAAWHEWVLPWSAEVRFLRGRLRFVGAAAGAPFPSALVIYRRGDRRCSVSSWRAPR